VGQHETSQPQLDPTSPDGGADPVGDENDEVGTRDAGARADAGGADSGSAPDLTTIILRNEQAPTTPPDFVLILVSAPDGTRIDAARTDAKGKAELNVPPGSTVTTIAESNYTVDGETRTPTSMVSWFDVPDVDPIYLNISKRSGVVVTTQTEPVEIEVTLVSHRTGTAGDSGELFIPCNGTFNLVNGNSVGFSADLFSGIKPCPGANEIEVWGFARGGWAYGTIPLDPTVKPQLTLTAENLDWDTSTLFIEGVPAGTERVNYAVWAAMNLESPGRYQGNSVLSPLAEEMLPIEVPHALLHHVNSGAFVQIQDQPGIEAYASRRGSQVADLRWNVSQDLALVETASLLPREIASRPEVTWHTAEVGNLGDYVEVTLQWRDVTWVAHLPAVQRGRVQLPVLPAGPDRFAPWPDDEMFFEGVSMTDELFLDNRAGVFGSSYVRSENYNQTSYVP
jgi:hypothetical protein